jgi:hypothetical protein
MRIRHPGASTAPFLFLVLALAFIHGPGAAQNDKKLRCAKCGTTGKIANKFLTPEMAGMEEKVIHCSYVLEKDRKGRGLPWIPCARCRVPELAEAAKLEFDKIVAQKEKWLERRRQIDELVGTDLLHLETEHFIIAWDIPKIVTRDKKSYKMHAAMHLYADRMESFYGEFMSFFGIEDKEIRNKKHFVYLFERQKHCFKAAKELTGLHCWNAAKLPGNPSILVSWYDKENLPTEEELHRHLVHHLSHLLNVSYYRMEWLAADAGWADEGLAHFWEYKYFNRADNTCDEEGEEEVFSHSDWEYEVRSSLDAGKGPSFAELSKKSTTALHGLDHQFSWSFMDFLLKKKDPSRFKVFMKAIKEKKETRDAIKEAYGLNVISFQREWEEYVRANYRDKPLKGPGQPRRNRKR